MNQPTSTAIRPNSSPHSHIGQVKRGMARPNATPYIPPQKQLLTITGTPNGGTGVVR